MKQILHIALLIGSLISCSETTRHFPRYEGFPDEKALNAQVIHLDTALFRYPFRVAVKDGIAIVMGKWGTLLLSLEKTHKQDPLEFPLKRKEVIKG